MSSGSIHRPGYQRRDALVVDYQEYELAQAGLWFRGPEPGGLADGTFISFMGAAQTFGCFCERPFPSIVGERTGRGVRNLGYGGAGPRFFADNSALIEEANRGALAVLQVMSGRSEDNRLFESGGLEFLRRRRDGARLSSREAYGGLVGGFDPVTGRPRTRNVRRLNARLGRPRLRRVVAETRRNWVDSYRRLFDRLTVPTILVWFSVRPPDYHTSFTSLSRLMSSYPQLVDAEMVAAVRDLADDYVECISSVGLPQALRSRVDGSPVTVDPAEDRPDFAGEQWSHNTYYPSPEMHLAAADELVPVLSSRLGA